MSKIKIEFWIYKRLIPVTAWFDLWEGPFKTEAAARKAFNEGFREDGPASKQCYGICRNTTETLSFMPNQPQKTRKSP